MPNPFFYYLSRPKHWPGLLAFSIISLVALLPLKLQVLLGRGVGKVMLLLASRRKFIAETNLRLCFPEKTPAERESLLRENFALTGLALVETAACWFSGLNSRLRRTSIVGAENLEAALDKNKGVILLSFHMTSLEVGGSLLAHHYPILAMYKPNKNSLVEAIMCHGRKRHVRDLLKQNDVKGTIRALKNNQIVWYATDQNYGGGKSSVFVPFFGIQASTITATSKFVKLTGATVVPFIQRRSDDGQSIELTLHPPFSDFPGESEEIDAARINAFLENYLRQHPADYMWLHQRFRSRPAGEARIYPKRSD